MIYKIKQYRIQYFLQLIFGKYIILYIYITYLLNIYIYKLLFFTQYYLHFSKLIRLKKAISVSDRVLMLRLIYHNL